MAHRDALTQAIGVLEQARAGLVNGAAVSAAEVQSARDDATRAAREIVESAVDEGPEAAANLLAALPPWGEALLGSVLDRLRASAAAWLAPPPAGSVETPHGTFVWSEGSYVREHPSDTGPLWVRLADLSSDEVDARLRAHAWFPSRLDEVVETARRYGAEESLPLHVAGYAEEGAVLSVDELRARLTPTHVSLEEDQVTVDFDDGDAFWGHAISVTCDVAGRPLDVTLSG
ncbi:MAG: hypothetical protein H6721_26125 [Sandaracinus sp.]|nr:hypothetical protein [Sandaracinus sp.]MCB9622596.1 hypothetical protein [Sandaracinus sp.]MCB9635612.1 hypothetical protein [Sandaracinus sp.]